MKQVILLLLLAWITTGQTFGQRQETYLTLDSAIHLTLQQSRELQIDHSKIEAAKARFLQAKSKELPTASIGASYTRLSDNVEPFLIDLPGSNSPKVLNAQIVNRYTPTLSVGQVLYAGGQIKYAERSMQLLEEVSILDYENDKTAIIYTAISAYFNLFKIQQTKTVIEENIHQVEEHLRNIKTFEKNGIALKNDVLKIELQLSSLGHSLIEINSTQEIAEYNLSILLGLPTGSTYQLETKDINDQPAIKSILEYQQEAQAQRPDLKGVDKKIGVAILGIKSATANYFPTVRLAGNYYYNRPNAREFPLSDRFKATWDAGISLNWNLHSLYTNQHHIAENKAILNQTQSQKDKLQDDIKMEVNADYVAFNKNKEKIRVSEQAVQQSEENYRIVNKRFLNNTVLISDLTDANTLLLQARINLLVDKADAGLAYYKLLQSTGYTK
jgi:outer membrane protein